MTLKIRAWVFFPFLFWYILMPPIPPPRIRLRCFLYCNTRYGWRELVDSSFCEDYYYFLLCPPAFLSHGLHQTPSTHFLTISMPIMNGCFERSRYTIPWVFFLFPCVFPATIATFIPHFYHNLGAWSGELLIIPSPNGWPFNTKNWGA